MQHIWVCKVAGPDSAGALVGTAVGHVLQRQRQAFDRIEGLATQSQAVILQQQPNYADEGQVRLPRRSDQVEALLVRAPSEILFERGSSALTRQGSAKVKEVATVLREYPESDIYVRGYSSSEGDDRSNFELSQRRAEVVRNELAAAGVSTSCLDASKLVENDEENLETRITPSGKASRYWNTQITNHRLVGHARAAN